MLIFENGSWRTLFTRPFGVDAVFGVRISNLAVDEINRRVYYISADRIEWWDVDSQTFHGGASLPTVGVDYDSLAFNPDDGFLYGVRGSFQPTTSLDRIDPATGAVTVMMALDRTMHRFNTLDYNRSDNSFYGFNTGAGFSGAPTGLYRIDILGDHSITQVTEDPIVGAATGATVRGDEVFVTRSAGNAFPNQAGTISTFGPPWSDFPAASGPVSGTERATAMALWLFPPPTDPADLNGDGAVNGGDITAILNGFGSTDPSLDLNQDGVVDGGDITMVLNSWTG
ncbi:MAG: hypothetical protein D6693_05990 [Planctomycetota bacterium]|nr:MAG: hypothetical protein D6693_05990 [Planctomycetota bacterium]